MATSITPSGIIIPSHNPIAWATEADWERHKEHFRDLHGRNTLTEVMRIMEIEHGFKAT